MDSEMWRWADPSGQQRSVRLDELRAALAGGHIPPNTPVWKPGWNGWQAAHDVPELTTSALSAANGVVPNIPPPPLAVLAVQHELERKAAESFAPPPPAPQGHGFEPPPPPAFVPAAVKAPSVAPPPVRSAPPPPVGAGAPIASTLPTTIGLPPPPELAAMAAARSAGAPPPPSSQNAGGADPRIEEISASMLLESDPSPLEANGAHHGPVPSPLDPAMQRDSLTDVPGLPRSGGGLAVILEELKGLRHGRMPKNKLLLPVLAIVSLSVGISVLAIGVSLMRSNDAREAEPASSASAAPSSAASGRALAGGRDAVPPPATTAKTVPPPEPASRGLHDCVVAGAPITIAPRAVVPSGIEAEPLAGVIAIGFASSAREGAVVSVDPATMAKRAAARAHAVGGEARRVTPMLAHGKIAAVTDVDRRGDKIAGRRVVATEPPIDVGVAEGGLVWAPHRKNGWAKVFDLEGSGAVEALRAVPLGFEPGIAVVFRRDGGIYAGVAKGEGVLTPAGALARIDGLGQVGSPTVAVSGDRVVVAWADRSGGQDPWQVRYTSFAAGGAPDAPKELALPEGGLGAQAMSPSVAALGAGRYLLAWTEGEVANHQVRAMGMNADGTPAGSALTISAPGVNAGQPQIAIGEDGRGVVAYLAAHGSKYEVHATPIACAGR